VARLAVNEPWSDLGRIINNGSDESGRGPATHGTIFGDLATTSPYGVLLEAEYISYSYILVATAPKMHSRVGEDRVG